VNKLLLETERRTGVRMHVTMLFDMSGFGVAKWSELWTLGGPRLEWNCFIPLGIFNRIASAHDGHTCLITTNTFLLNKKKKALHVSLSRITLSKRPSKSLAPNMKYRFTWTTKVWMEMFAAVRRFWGTCEKRHHYKKKPNSPPPVYLLPTLKV